MSKPNPKRGTRSSSRKATARDAADKDESADRTASKSAVPGSGSGTGGSGGGGGGSATRTPNDADAKDETTTNGDKKDVKTPDDTTATAPTAPKPQSASITIRDAGQKLLTLTMKQEWNSIDPVLKQLEKVVAAGGGETHTAPLAGLADPVRHIKKYILNMSFKIWVKVISIVPGHFSSHRTCVKSVSTRPIYILQGNAQNLEQCEFQVMNEVKINNFMKIIRCIFMNAKL